MPTRTAFDRLPNENESNSARLATLQQRGSPPNPYKAPNLGETLPMPSSTAEHTDQENPGGEDCGMGVRHYLQWIIEHAPGLSEAKKDEVRSDLQWLNDGQPSAPTAPPFIGPVEAEFCAGRLTELVLHCVTFQVAGRRLTGITSDDMRAVKRYVDAQLERWNEAHTEARRNALVELLPRITSQGRIMEIIQTALFFYQGELLDVPAEALVSLKKYLDKQEP